MGIGSRGSIVPSICLVRWTAPVKLRVCGCLLARDLVSVELRELVGQLPPEAEASTSHGFLLVAVVGTRRALL